MTPRIMFAFICNLRTHFSRAEILLAQRRLTDSCNLLAGEEAIPSCPAGRLLPLGTAPNVPRPRSRGLPFATDSGDSISLSLERVTGEPNKVDLGGHRPSPMRGTGQAAAAGDVALGQLRDGGPSSSASGSDTTQRRYVWNHSMIVQNMPESGKLIGWDISRSGSFCDEARRQGRLEVSSGRRVTLVLARLSTHHLADCSAYLVAQSRQPTHRKLASLHALPVWSTGGTRSETRGD